MSTFKQLWRFWIMALIVFYLASFIHNINVPGIKVFSYFLIDVIGVAAWLYIGVEIEYQAIMKNIIRNVTVAIIALFIFAINFVSWFHHT